VVAAGPVREDENKTIILGARALWPADGAIRTPVGGRAPSPREKRMRFQPFRVL